MSIRIGLVGLGAFGTVFADLFKAHPLVSRVGLCDREPERVARFAQRDDWRDKFDPRDTYDSLEAICAADFDALVIITQPWLHAPQCIAAMESGKHVYSAVPVISLPDGDEVLDWVDRIIRTCERTGMHYMLGETSYFHPGTMYCRRRAAAGDFGDFVYAEGEYLHDTDSPQCSLRVVHRNRMQGKAGAEWAQQSKRYRERGVRGGPMHYPTHSVSGPMSVMKAHGRKVVCFGYDTRTGDPAFGSPSNETALFTMSNGATLRICEHREIGMPSRETFRVYGTRASFEDNAWADKHRHHPLTAEEMRDPLPEEVELAWRDIPKESEAFGGHEGSHPYLVHEFVSAIAQGRRPAIDAWTAARYMAAGITAHKSALRGGEVLEIPDWGDAPR